MLCIAYSSIPNLMNRNNDLINFLITTNCFYPMIGIELLHEILLFVLALKLLLLVQHASRWYAAEVAPIFN